MPLPQESRWVRTVPGMVALSCCHSQPKLSHVHCGRSGSGKSKFIEGLLWQLIIKNQGCAFIDPHADSANHLLKLLVHHPHRKGKAWLDDPSNASKLIYCEPGRSDYVIPWNIFKTHGDPYTIATNVWEAFRRTWSSSLSAAPQSKNIAIHCLLLLIENRMTLVDLPRLLIDEQLRTSLVERSRNPEVIKFFQNRFSAWGKQGLQRAEPLLNKVTALTLNDNLRRMLGAQENRLNLRQIMDRGQVLIVNLGWCDQETRALMGSLLTVSLEQAAMSRVKIPERLRRPFFCVIDEFQGFVDADGSSHILSETRKAKCGLLLPTKGNISCLSADFKACKNRRPSRFCLVVELRQQKLWQKRCLHQKWVTRNRVAWQSNARLLFSGSRIYDRGKLWCGDWEIG